MKATLPFTPLLVFIAAVGLAQPQTYQQPPPDVLAVLHAPLPPAVFLNPTRDTLILAQRMVYPPIADLAEPMLRLAGVRVNPRTNAERSYLSYFLGLTLKRLADGRETPLPLPAHPRLSGPRWTADGTRLAFSHEAADHIELWLADAASGQARALPGLRLNPLLGPPMVWMPDQRTLLVRLIPERRGPPPEAPASPPGPKIQESTGTVIASSTYEVRDVLKNEYDADLFDYYTTSQLALVDAASGRITRLGPAGVFGLVAPAPDGRHLLVERLLRPYSYQRAHYRFARAVEVWTTGGERVQTLASLPLAEQVPIDGVPTGPRSYAWCPTEPATLIWIEALDGGNPKTKVPHRDRVMRQPVPGAATEFLQLEHRMAGLRWIDTGKQFLVSDFDRDRRWTRTFLADSADPAGSQRLLWDLSADEKYGDPGSPVYRVLPTGASAVHQQGDWIYLAGDGYSPEGDRPFLDRLNLRTLQTERLFRADRSSYEFFLALVDPAAETFLTRRESPTDPPNVQLRTLAPAPLTGVAPGEAGWASTPRAINRFPDPAPQLRGITKRLVTYQRADGMPLSFTLYLPPGYREGTRLPTVFWAYPLDYAGKEVAGQIEGSSQYFTRLTGDSELFFLLRGYAVLADVAMPVVGPPETVYDTFVEQIVADVKAAIDKAVELGVTDPERVGVGGHSHGALMTANLLAYSDLFRAGIARSGAYNHTMRPFGFQNEKRTLWQARDVYIKISPVLQADKINKPLLLIHGEIDQNPGTVPLQSEKLYEAIRGVGGTVRLVMLPYESHGYQARESTEHVLFEMLAWFDRHVKNAPPRTTGSATPKT